MTLLSSTSQPALSPLLTIHTDSELPSDSFVTCLPDSQASLPETYKSYIPIHPSKGNIVQPVIHIQSPSIHTTYIQAGCSQIEARKQREKGKGRVRCDPLGVELQWVGMQVKRLGRREMSFEIGILDSRGREGIIRCSSFQVGNYQTNVFEGLLEQKIPTAHTFRSPPLIHLPLALPKASSSTVTSWLHISLNLAQVIPLFQTLPRSGRHGLDDTEASPKIKSRKISDLPSGKLGSITFLRVYANCRIRRIWFVRFTQSIQYTMDDLNKAAEGEKTMENMGKNVMEEWGLCAAEDA